MRRRVVVVLTAAAATIVTALLAAPAAAPHHAGGRGNVVVVGRDATIDHPVNGDVQVYRGTATVRDVVDGDLLVFGDGVAFEGNGRVTHTTVPIEERKTDAEGAFVVDAIRAKPLCVACIIRETGVTRVRTETIFTRLSTTLTVMRLTAQCGGCRIERDVFRLA